MKTRRRWRGRRRRHTERRGGTENDPTTTKRRLLCVCMMRSRDILTRQTMPSDVDRTIYLWPSRGKRELARFISYHLKLCTPLILVLHSPSMWTPIRDFSLAFPYGAHPRGIQPRKSSLTSTPTYMQSFMHIHQCSLTGPCYVPQPRLIYTC